MVTHTKATSKGLTVWVFTYHGDNDPGPTLHDAVIASLGDSERETLSSEDPKVRVEVVRDLVTNGGKIINMELRTPLANLVSSEISVSEEQLTNIIELSKGFHLDGSIFEMWTDYGFVVVPPDITRSSILTINIKDDEVQDI
jgi:hypothetical protein